MKGYDGLQQDTRADMNTYTVKYDELEGRLDPSAYHPTRLNAVKKIKALNCDVLPLSQVATFKREVVTKTSKDTPYYGLENIESDIGIVSNVEKGKDFGSAFSFKAGNILFPKLRPYLNKVHLASTEGVCSTEFHILEANKCNNYYLFAFLSSHLVVNQTSYLMTGNTLPRLQTKDVEDLLIPILPEAKQKHIAALLKKAYKIREQKLKQDSKVAVLC
ncbi:MAG: restriction endonuclease subunit S [Thermoproteota archaeon]